MKKTAILFILFILCSADIIAQQDPHYTQYMYNMNVINPAYAGSKENLSIGLLYRKQWVELEDAPTTLTASGHSPVGKNIGVGLSAISDKIGPVSENNIFADLSYTVQMGGEHKLALGMKAGISNLNIALLDKVSPTLIIKTDGAFSENTSTTNFNIGSGIFYYTDKYYLSFSIPNFLKTTHIDSRGVKYGSETQHYFLSGGYVFNLNSNVKFKPFFMVKSAIKAPTSFDLSTNFLFFEKFETGATYRLQDSFGAMINYKITPSLRIGYAYDHIISDLKVTTPSSHEVILLFDLNFPKKVSSSPRYF